MPGILISLLIAIVFLLLVQFILDSIGLKEPARKILWIIAIVVAIWYVIDPGIFVIR